MDQQQPDHRAKTPLGNRTASTSLLLLLCTWALPMLQHTVQAQERHVLFTDLPHAATGISASPILAGGELRSRLVRLQPTAADGTLDLSRPLEINLFHDLSFTVQLQRDPRPAYRGLQVWKGRVADHRFDHLPQYRNTLFVLNTATGKLVAQVETEQGFFQVLPAPGPGEYRVRQCKPFGNGRCGILAAHPGQLPASGTRAACDTSCNETDAAGRYVVDVFAGYSDAAAALAGDLEAHAQANLETVNMGLANSLQDTVYLRLVGTGTTPNNPGIVTSVLEDAWSWFSAANDSLAPDLITVFQTPTGAPGSAGGWGGMPGRTSVCGVEWGTVFRHEAGHNAGGNHCYPDNADFRNGMDNGHWRTHLCGNDVNFYSTPLVNDDQGTPIGNTDQADMVRQWAEMAPVMARYAMHRVPYFEGDTCAGRICLPQHWGGAIEYIDQVLFNTIDNQQADPAWNCAAVTGYSDYTEQFTEVARGSTHELYVSATASWEESTMRAWIDWDHDGLFTADEQVMDLFGTGPWYTPVTVPDDAALAAVRLRVRLQYGLDNDASPCNASDYSSGESEDYTVQVVEGIPAGVAVAGPAPTELALFPNPAKGTVRIQASGLEAGPVWITITGNTGQMVLSAAHVWRGQAEAWTLDIGNLAPGVYTAQLHHPAQGLFTARLVKE